MGHVFRIKKHHDENTDVTFEGWNSTETTTYTRGYVDEILDQTVKQEEVCSIPSPFARIELVKQAFDKVALDNFEGLSPKQIKEILHANTIYHKLVSASLDVGQIFFNYPIFSKSFEIIRWNKDQQIRNLLESENESLKRVGRSLEMFLNQDARGDDTYNFGQLNNFYILCYKGEKCKQEMHIVGATSPATLFFPTANNETQISKQICFGNHYAFDESPVSLDQRAPDFIKYLFALAYSIPNFNRNYPEVLKYLNVIFRILNDDVKRDIRVIHEQCENNNQPQSYLSKTYNVLKIEERPNGENEQQITVEVNGNDLFTKKTDFDAGSDFVIASTKKDAIKPLVLPIVYDNIYAKLTYWGTPFGNNIKVPYKDSTPVLERNLPGVGVQHPYLTISDFLEDTIVRLPSAINTEDYFDGHSTTSSKEAKGYLLPIKDEYFKYFTIEDLKKSIKITELAGSGVEVELTIPIQHEYNIVYRRLYNVDVKAKPEENEGAIVNSNEDLAIGVFPPIKYSNERDAFYRVVILTDNTLYKECSCRFYPSQEDDIPTYVVRNPNECDDLTSIVYILDNKTFEFARVTIQTDNGTERNGSGLMIPNFKQQMNNNDKITFAIDLGTSNTHIEYNTSSERRPVPLEFSRKSPLLSLLFKSESPTVMDHLRAEFIPESIGQDELCKFPMRTVLCIDKQKVSNKEMGVYRAFGNAAPAFMYNRKQVGTRYNEYVSNLKWSDATTNQNNVQLYIESLFLLIRAKVLELGGNVSATKIRWFYPISMPSYRINQFELTWTECFHKYFDSQNAPEAVTESIAPYSFFQDDNQNIADLLTIDIGGGTTDIVAVNNTGVKCISSFKFAADAIFGASLVALEGGTLNGILRQCKDIFIKNLSGDKELCEMLKNMTVGNCGNSTEVASFLFSLADNQKVIHNGFTQEVNFHTYLQKENSQKIVFFIFYTAIIYHVAHLMKANNLDIPPHIAFSGNGSKVLSVLSPREHTLEKLTSRIFKFVFGCQDNPKITIHLNTRNPKEATCKGGLLLTNDSNDARRRILDEDDVKRLKSVLLIIKDGTFVTEETYETVSNKDFCDKVVEDVRDYERFIFDKLIDDKYSLSSEFGINKKYQDLARECFKQDLSVFIGKGIENNIGSNENARTELLQETLFFYPIIGVMNDLSDKISNSLNK